MNVFTRRRIAVGLALLVMTMTGCRQKAVPELPVVTTEVVPTEPGEIELFNPKAKWNADRKLVEFEVSYRFTKGRPSKYYLVEVLFPGTKNIGAKTMERWELKEEGVIKDGIPIHQPPVKTFEIKMSEADSPQNGYHKISNVVGGEIK